MGVSLKIYRQRIGCFSNNCLNKKTLKFKSTAARNHSSLFMLKIIRILLISSVCFYLAAESDFQPSGISSYQPKSQSVCSFHPCGFWRFNTEAPLQPSGISWSYLNDGNKLSHALQGNKRNPGYTYLAWNCARGFLSERKIDDLKITINRHKPHLIGISEIDLFRKENNSDLFATNNFSTEQLQEKLAITGYRIFLPKSWETLGTARIIVYAKDDLKIQHLYPQDACYDHVQNITLEVGFGRSKTHFCNFYYREWTSCKTKRSDPKSQNEELELLLDIWRNSTKDNKDFVALGDMNLCAKKWDEPSYQYKDLANSVKDFMFEENCSQLIDSITRIRSVNGTLQRSCLDHATVNCVQKISSPVVIGVGKSDHLGIMITKASKEVRTFARTTKKRIYKNFKRDAFLKDIEEAKRAGKFDGIFLATSPDEAFEIFEQSFCEVLNCHAPIKVIQNRNDYVPYITPELNTLMSERDKMKEKAANTGRLDDYEEYKRRRNEVSTLMKSSESNYFKEKFNEENITSKNVWKTAYEVLGNTRSSFPSQILHGGRLLSNPSLIASEVNKYFVEKIQKLKDEFETDPDEDPVADLKKYLSQKNIPNEGFSLKELSNEDVKKLLKNLKGKKSLGLDWICGYSLKIASAHLTEELQCLINICIRKNKFVEKWKTSKILPGWKNKGTRFELRFYRPISKLSEVSKLVERAVYDQMYDYLLSNDLIHQNHHGFLKGSSTSSALQHMFDLWLQRLDKGYLAAALFLDLSAGFDVISHRILLMKMKEYNITEDTVQWFSSYLLDRHQCVQIESSFSPTIPVPWGVPQGSILGPLLFLFFLNELPNIVKNDPDEAIEEQTNINKDEIVIYADDNTPTTADADPICLQTKIQEEANLVINWFTENEMICSSEKTKLLIIGTGAARKSKLEDQNLSLSVNICGEAKSETSSEKLLGVVVNNTCTFKHHLYGDTENQGLLKQLSSRVGMLKRLRKHMPITRLRTVMEGLFSSKLSYGITVWGRIWNIPGSLDVDASTRASPSITKDDLRKIQVLQNKCLRIVTNSDYRTPTSELLKKTNMLSVHQQMAQLSLSQVYSIYSTKLPAYHYQRLFSNNKSRSADNHSVNRVEFKLSLARTHFFYQSSRLWSALPDHVKSANNKSTFKKRCRSWVKVVGFSI